MEPERTQVLADQMMMLITGGWVAQAINATATLGVADELAHGPRTAEDLARAVGADADALYRLLRALSGCGVVAELDGRRFVLTELGGLLRRDAPDSLGGFAAMLDRPFHSRSWADLAETVRTGRSSFERLFGGWSHFRNHPEDAAILNDGMTAASGGRMKQLVWAYDFTPLGTIVDVGGGHGALLAHVLSGHPKGRGVLFELPHVIATAGAPLVEAGVADRCKLVGGDFFDSVPAGGDAYLLANVVHDWGDEAAARILANCGAAMTDGGRVLLFEGIVPSTPNEPTPVTLIDLEMMVMAEGGRQRTEAEFERLLARAGLRLSGVTTPGGTFSLIEAVPG
jgi:hypothetical protein